MTEPLIGVENLNVTFRGRGSARPALSNVSLSLGAEKLGIVGESGSGKSTIGRAIMGLLPPNASVRCDRLSYRGHDLLAMPADKLARFRGRNIAMILQDPKHALNPTVRVGDQIAEAYRIHTRAGRGEALDRALQMLETVEIRSPARVMTQYPHEMSGGMGQRIMIAMMLVCDPDVLIADEPTSALDASVKASVMDTIERLVRERNMGLMFISHDLPQVARSCDRVMILYQGRTMETLSTGQLPNAQHPYTRGLLECVPTVGRRRARLPVLERDASWMAE